MNLKITICRDKRNMVKPYVCCWYGELDQGIGDCAEGCNGTGGAHPRSRFWARYTADTTVTISRG
ncbi:MAG: hypothetical protein JXB29_04485, partial [Sedimentisphaerales bacterium]|nr:hypothetical protein [Sedimentisphaerales bacterium]